MTITEAFSVNDLPDTLTDLSHVIDMVDGWVLRNEQIDPDLAAYAANLLALIAQKSTPQ
jgi:hypothetical protein